MAAAKPVTCPSCGFKKNAPGSVRCASCGAKFDEPGRSRRPRAPEDRYQQEGVSVQWLVIAFAVQAVLTTAEATNLDTKTLFGLEQDLLNLSDAIGSHYFPHGPNASRPEKLTGLA